MTETMLQTIADTVQGLDIAGYLKEEVMAICKHLHYYKLKNILDNMQSFGEYLVFLDHHSTKQIHTLEYDPTLVHEIGDHDLAYYLSTHGLEVVGEAKIRQKLRENHYSLSYIMQAVKGYLLLTADEFCNASGTRIAINKFLWEKETKKK